MRPVERKIKTEGVMRMERNRHEKLLDLLERVNKFSDEIGEELARRYAVMEGINPLHPDSFPASRENKSMEH